MERLIDCKDGACERAYVIGNNIYFHCGDMYYYIRTCAAFNDRFRNSTHITNVDPIVKVLKTSVQFMENIKLLFEEYIPNLIIYQDIFHKVLVRGNETYIIVAMIVVCEKFILSFELGLGDVCMTFINAREFMMVDFEYKSRDVITELDEEIYKIFDRYKDSKIYDRAEKVPIFEDLPLAALICCDLMNADMIFQSRKGNTFVITFVHGKEWHSMFVNKKLICEDEECPLDADLGMLMSFVRKSRTKFTAYIIQNMTVENHTVLGQLAYLPQFYSAENIFRYIYKGIKESMDFFIMKTFYSTKKKDFMVAHVAAAGQCIMQFWVSADRTEIYGKFPGNATKISIDSASRVSIDQVVSSLPPYFAKDHISLLHNILQR